MFLPCESLLLGHPRRGACHSSEQEFLARSAPASGRPERGGISPAASAPPSSPPWTSWRSSDAACECGPPCGQPRWRCPCVPAWPRRAAALGERLVPWRWRAERLA
jgi:hypothetical protein